MIVSAKSARIPDHTVKLNRMYFVLRISYYVFRITYFVLRISYYVFRIMQYAIPHTQYFARYIMRIMRYATYAIRNTQYVTRNTPNMYGAETITKTQIYLSSSFRRFLPSPSATVRSYEPHMPRAMAVRRPSFSIW